MFMLNNFYSCVLKIFCNCFYLNIGEFTINMCSIFFRLSKEILPQNQLMVRFSFSTQELVNSSSKLSTRQYGLDRNVLGNLLSGKQVSFLLNTKLQGSDKSEKNLISSKFCSAWSIFLEDFSTLKSYESCCWLLWRRHFYPIFMIFCL